MDLMRRQCESPEALRALLPAERGVESAERHLADFRRWCAGDNALGERVLGIENVALSFSEAGLGIAAARELAAGEVAFHVPPRMLLPATLEATTVVMGARLGEARLTMLRRAQQLTTERLGMDLSTWVLLWQLLVEAHAETPVTPNPSSALEPWLRTYRYSTMYPRGWSDAELAWVGPLPWACAFIETSEFCYDAMGELRRTTDCFCDAVLPTLREEFPQQLPPSHFTDAGFEWAARLYRTRNMGGLLVPLHDIMNHDLANHNVAFTDGIENVNRLCNPERRYIANTVRLTSGCRW